MRISDWSSDVCSSDLIRPTDCGKDRAGSGDHSRLYDLIWKRALASQMASARMERTTVELADGTGRTALRATGQVVLFPGSLALYEEGSDDKGFVCRPGQQADAAVQARKSLPPLRHGENPAKQGLAAHTHFIPHPPP